ncbi:MAG: serine/threonine protein phosphatase [Sphingomonas sp.]|jgi:serine/threonine protein phosphatase 1|uniref:metallophosphoesterase family protein n=1 Tax=Sphingomonas sp. CD22 TaxID=3100214 RepID=UPI00120F7199|nr:metallophosphoesterase family protein [Sphingomonas sp. CD22]MEA1084363.1 metallophosphoesterase family protein [Sphingomonas sp. CD22]RZL54415.1 MAG: serine/threonine protein phosphatase [Sphingomonas sp.]
MLKKLLNARRSTVTPLTAIPEGERVYAVGDVHGCADLLDQLLARIDADDRARGPARTTIVFLGDLVDRGPASAAVIERLRLLAAERPDTRFLLGNHEEVFLESLKGEPKALRMFCRIGGRETIMSYGIDAADYDRMDYEELHAAMRVRVPAAHQAFLESFEDMVTIGDYVFVHAGVRPGTELTAQRGADLRWIRNPFLDHDRALDKMVVHGHTISAGLDEQVHRIGVDTGAYETGILTALGLEGSARWTVQATRAE